MHSFHFTSITLVGLKSNIDILVSVWVLHCFSQNLLSSLISEEVAGAAAWSLPWWSWLPGLPTRSSILRVTGGRTSAWRASWWPEIWMAWRWAPVVGVAGWRSLAHCCSPGVVGGWSALGLHSLQIVKVRWLTSSVWSGSSRTTRATSHALGALSHCFLS